MPWRITSSVMGSTLVRAELRGSVIGFIWWSLWLRQLRRDSFKERKCCQAMVIWRKKAYQDSGRPETRGAKRMAKQLGRFSSTMLHWVVVLGLAIALLRFSLAQERRVKTRISNAAFIITALPLLAARDRGIFPANGLDVEIILMNSALVPPALIQGDIDYQAGVGPASVNAMLSGFPTRAIWFSSDKIPYLLMSRPQFKSLEIVNSE